MHSVMWSVLLLLVAVGCVLGHLEGRYVRTCYMLFGPLSDLGYTFAHNKGRTSAHNKFMAAYPHIHLESLYELNVFFNNPTEVAQVKRCGVILLHIAKLPDPLSCLKCEQ